MIPNKDSQQLFLFAIRTGLFHATRQVVGYGPSSWLACLAVAGTAAIDRSDDNGETWVQIKPGGVIYGT